MLDTKEAHINVKPYKFAAGTLAVGQEMRVLANWLEQTNDWSLHEESFFSQWELSLDACDLPSNLSWVNSRDFIERLKLLVSDWFDTPLASDYHLVAHRLCDGQRICTHTDAPRPGYETHRLAICLSDFKSDSAGGHWCVLSSKNESSISNVIRPMFGSFFSFEATNKSFHAVVPVNGYSRLSIVANLWHPANHPTTIELLNSLIEQATKANEYLIYTIGSKLINCYDENRFDKIEHGIATLKNHLLQTAYLLALWTKDRDLIIAGLAHSVQGTPHYKLGDESLPDDVLSQLISAEAKKYISEYNECLKNPGDTPSDSSILISLANNIANATSAIFSRGAWEQERVYFCRHIDRLPLTAREICASYYMLT